MAVVVQLDAGACNPVVDVTACELYQYMDWFTFEWTRIIHFGKWYRMYSVLLLL